MNKFNDQLQKLVLMATSRNDIVLAVMLPIIQLNQWVR
jgi:hypothetical protein